MLKSKLDQLKTREGFTIIEVIIVLVVAAVIMLAVFLVVPALQRQQRNNRRQSDARAVLAAIEQYRSEKGGSNPGGSPLSLATLETEVETITGNLTDPSGTAYSWSTTAAANPLNNTMYIYFGEKCNTQGYSASISTTPATGATAIVVPQQPATGSTNAGFCVSG